MRTSAIALALLLSGASSTSAQVTGAGVRAGVNFATLDTADDAGSAPVDPQWRPVVSGFLTWRALSWLELQPEVAYSLKGARNDEASGVSKVLLDYVEVPILARFSRGATAARRFYGVGGAALSALVRARTRVDLGDVTEELDIRDDVETVDWGLVVGGGLEIGSVVVDVRYTHGLRDIDRDTTDTVTVRTRTASFTAGVRF